jgi:menaquinone-9 beta-reductase
MNRVNTYSCAVIGGGLAGLTLAIQLQSAGVDTILFEKEQYPFHKVCGEYISMESWNFLEELGVPLSGMSLPRITHLNVSSPNGNKLSQALDPGGFGISRYALDHKLYLIAKKSGVTILDNCKVFDVITEGQSHLIKTTAGDFYSAFVCGSWGKRSNMDVKLGRDFILSENRRLNNYVAVKYHIKADLPQHIIELHNFRNGYCGISKIDGDKYCMCYLVKGDELKRVNGSIKTLEEAVLMKNPFLRHYFSTVEFLYEKPLSISQISFGNKTRSQEGIMMLGDAAGLITPLCGNGMSMAMHASKLLSLELIRFFENRQSKSQLYISYDAAWQKQFRQRLKAGRFIQSLFGNEGLTNITIAALKPFPFLVKKLVEATHGKPF